MLTNRAKLVLVTTDGNKNMNEDQRKVKPAAGCIKQQKKLVPAVINPNFLDNQQGTLAMIRIS